MKRCNRKCTRLRPAFPAAPALLIVLTLAAVSHAAYEFDHTHRVYNAILKTHVTDGRVDYQALKDRPGLLTQYIKTLAAVSERQFSTFTEAQQLAFLFNLYNAATLKLIVDHHPVQSIKDIGNWLRGPWDQAIVRLFGKTITLNELEHEILRARYNEPRLHMALVCAAKSCPPLRGEPYTAKRLDSQLNDQARTFLNTPEGLRINRRTSTVYVSSIFKWYGKDFVDSYTPAAGFTGLGKPKQAIASFCSRYVPIRDRDYLKTGGYDLKYLDYDWSLNE